MANERSVAALSALVVLVMATGVCCAPVCSNGFGVIVEDPSLAPSGAFHVACGTSASSSSWQPVTVQGADATPYVSIMNAVTGAAGASPPNGPASVWSFATRNNACVVRELTIDAGGIAKETLYAAPSAFGNLTPCGNESRIVDFTASVTALGEARWMVATSADTESRLWTMSLDAAGTSFTASLFTTMDFQKTTAAGLDATHQVYYLANRDGVIATVDLKSKTVSTSAASPTALVRKLWWDASVGKMMAWVLTPPPPLAAAHTAPRATSLRGAPPANTTWSVVTVSGPGGTLSAVGNLTAWLDNHSPYARMYAVDTQSHSFWQFLPGNMLGRVEYSGHGTSVLYSLAASASSTVPWAPGHGLNMFAVGTWGPSLHAL